MKAVNSAARFASRVLMKGARTLRGENLDDHRLNGERRLLRWLDLPADAVIFDVGGNVGHWSKGALALFPSARIHAFEPLPGAFAQLSRVPGSPPTNSPWAPNPAPRPCTSTPTRPS